jgi:hypothetical protein
MDDGIRDFWTDIALVVGALPLGIYPFVLLANGMQLAAGLGSSGNAYALLGKFFLLGSTLYPIVYVLMFRASRRAQKRGASKQSLVLGVTPLLLVCTLLLSFWVLLTFPPPSQIHG